MSGLDAAITTLLTARSELFQSALRAAAGSTAGQTATQSGVANTSGTPDTYGPNPYGNAAPASTQTALSSVARTLDVISRIGGGAALPVTGNSPLWLTPPRPASAFAAFTTGLFDTAFSSNAAAVAAARAASQNIPPLPATQIAAQLAKTVDESGLFYESHLVQWLAGQRGAASLSNEPQARIDPRALALPLDFADEQAAGQAWLDRAPLPLLTSQIEPDLHDLPELQTGGRPVAMPQNPQQAAELAESVRDAPLSAFSGAQDTSGTAAAPTAQQAPPHESAVQASLAAGIHPAALNVVRQQLDMLANGQFHWQGEAWPGTRFDWEIEREPYDPRDAQASESDGIEQPWRTRVTLSLPALGLVDAELVLTGDKLTARIRANGLGASRFAGDGAAFARQLSAAGLSLASLSVRALDGTLDFDSNAATRPAAPKPVRSPLEHLLRASPEEGDGA